MMNGREGDSVSLIVDNSREKDRINFQLEEIS